MEAHKAEILTSHSWAGCTCLKLLFHFKIQIAAHHSTIVLKLGIYDVIVIPDLPELLRETSVKIGTIQRRLAWPLRKARFSTS